MLARCVGVAHRGFLTWDVRFPIDTNWIIGRVVAFADSVTSSKTQAAFSFYRTRWSGIASQISPFKFLLSWRQKL